MHTQNSVRIGTAIAHSFLCAVHTKLFTVYAQACQVLQYDIICEHILKELRGRLEGFPIVRYELAWHPPPRSKAFEASDKCRCRQVRHDIKMYSSSHTAGEETNPHLVWRSQASGTDVEWPSKVDTCKREWWFLFNSEFR